MYSLAVSYIMNDFIWGVPLIGSTILGAWPYGGTMCYILAFGVIWLNACSVCILFVLNLDRYIAVSRPLRYDAIMSTWKISVLVVSAWIVSFIFACLNAFLPYQRAFYKPDYHLCFFDPYKDEIIDFIGMTNLLFVLVLPILATVIIYRKIYKIAKAHAKEIASVESRIQTEADKQRKLDSKAAKAFLLVTIGFVFSWLPFLVAIGYEYVVNEEPPVLPWWCAFCASIGTSINVVIYYWRNEAFRQPARKLLPKRWRRVGPESAETSATFASNC